MKPALERSVGMFLGLVALVGSTGALAFVHRTTNQVATRAVPVKYTPSCRTRPSRKLSGLQYQVWTPSQVLPSSALYSSESSDDDETSTTPQDEESGSTTKLTFRERWAKIFPQNEGEKLPFRQRLAKMGLACVLSYGFVSNMNAGITTGLAWFVFAKRVSGSMATK